MDETSHVRRGQTRTLPLRTTCLAVTLTTIGVTLLIVGLVALGTSHAGAPALFVVGILTLVPGAYVLTNLVGTYRRWPGYNASFTDLELV